MSEKFSVVILAAGLGTRMKSGLAKVLHPLGGQPMIAYSLKLAQQLNPDKIFIVVGPQAERIKEVCSGSGNSPLEFVSQDKQLGTGHAMMQVEPHLTGCDGHLLVLCGDAPLLTERTAGRLLDLHFKAQAAASVLTMEVTNPSHYGRVIRGENGLLQRIVENKDASEEEQKIREVNSGIYCFQRDFLCKALKQVSCQNRQGEYYLTDVIEIASLAGHKVAALLAQDCQEAMGINNREDLAKAESIMRSRINRTWMLEGVTIVHPETTYIESTVEIGRDTVIFPNTYLHGQTRIGERCLLLPGTVIRDSILEDEVEVSGFSVITRSQLKAGVKVGPFAHLRPETVLQKGVKIGNFVEVKKSVIGAGTKANHLSYIGDATVGKGVNIGAGTITCNYDGKAKHPTYIEDDVFVGSDTQFVAPVTIGQGSLIGAGTTVTKDVPPHSLVVSRVEQKNLVRHSHSKKNK
ncbi:MAG: bifunctional UDP-N-acetylglucosamine diphosphorylase/glucosamine-1-phosphate N-acetyltransferase GlmU [Candidatus Tectomicrobia bacterium]|uniref:Bifunctional protein GlmU n=1 Tax=Tectimicrobiota bacterium TaxID=2528274 RepID=A0A933LQ37_UNCTE|nr:bifunctional UDP-N-acetylglucosamine diphosphorylase/glucosamine-1-phosphate N-acetyltransferase GlmU [Candidatus Tectomicrobia bacterium]